MGPKVNNSKQKNSNKKVNKESNSYLADDKNFDSFSAQLAKLGLELRDITGDGNCCFRALSDQMNGDESLHLEFRRRVCEYMQRNREEFEPFVAALIDDDNDDDTKKNKKTSKNVDAFDLYIKNLEKPGTYADNGVLVAFSRLYNLDINIHQLDQPIWTISGIVAKKNQPVRQLHLSYHNSEHYSSIRPKGDRTTNPTNIIVNSDSNKASNYMTSKPKSTVYNPSDFFESDDLENFIIDNDDDFKTFDDKLNNLNVGTIIDSTGINDVNLIMETLTINEGDVGMTIGQLLSQIQLDDEKKSTSSASKSGPVKKDKKKEKKEKKDRQMERQRIKILEQKEQEAHAAGNKKDIRPNQIVDLNPAALEPTDFNVLLNNIEKKSI